MLRLGWLTTARGPGSRGFFETVVRAIEAGELDARIEFVFSNREPGEGEGSDSFFRRARDLGIPLVTYSSARFRRERGGGRWAMHRDAFHAEAMRRIAGFDVDCCVMAGYMLITSGAMCREMTLLNLHPAAPGGPAGTWQEVIWELIGAGAERSGVTVHVATEVLDAGPMVSHCSFPIVGPRFDRLWADARSAPMDSLRAEGEDQPLFAAIRAEGMRREGPLLVETLRALSDGEVRLEGGGVVDGAGAGICGGLCLDGQVEAHLLGATG